MKIPILATLFLGFAAQSLIAAPHINIGDVKLERAHALTDGEDQLRQYLPHGETLDHWNRLASVQILKKQKNSKKYLTRLAEEMQQSNPMVKTRFFQNADQQTVLDSITFAPSDSPVKYAEWSLQRAHYVKGQGLVVFKYALRLYRLNKESSNVILTERNNILVPFVEATFDEQESFIKPREDLQSNIELVAREGWENPTDVVD